VTASSFRYDDPTRCPEEWGLDAGQRGEVDAVTVAALRAHLARCPRCRQIWADLSAGEELAMLLREAQRETDPAVRQRVIDTATTAARIRTSTRPQEEPA